MNPEELINVNRYVHQAEDTKGRTLHESPMGGEEFAGQELPDIA